VVETECFTTEDTESTEDRRRKQMPETTDAEKIWAVLASHREKSRSITAGAIALATSIGDEAGTKVREIISESFEFFPGMPVAAWERGYFVTETVEEAREYRRSLKQRIEMDGRRMAIYDRKMEAAGFIRNGDAYSPRQGLFVGGI
jgi:hypothetical protein